jgi:hypothetical protein
MKYRLLIVVVMFSVSFVSQNAFSVTSSSDLINIQHSLFDHLERSSSSTDHQLQKLIQQSSQMFLRVQMSLGKQYERFGKRVGELLHVPFVSSLTFLESIVRSFGLQPTSFNKALYAVTMARILNDHSVHIDHKQLDESIIEQGATTIVESFTYLSDEIRTKKQSMLHKKQSHVKKERFIKKRYLMILLALLGLLGFNFALLWKVGAFDNKFDQTEEETDKKIEGTKEQCLAKTDALSRDMSEKLAIHERSCERENNHVHERIDDLQVHNEEQQEKQALATRGLIDILRDNQGQLNRVNQKVNQTDQRLGEVERKHVGNELALRDINKQIGTVHNRLERADEQSHRQQLHVDKALRRQNKAVQRQFQEFSSDTDRRFEHVQRQGRIEQERNAQHRRGEMDLLLKHIESNNQMLQNSVEQVHRDRERDMNRIERRITGVQSDSIESAIEMRKDLHKDLEGISEGLKDIKKDQGPSVFEKFCMGGKTVLDTAHKFYETRSNNKNVENKVVHKHKKKQKKKEAKDLEHQTLQDRLLRLRLPDTVGVDLKELPDVTCLPAIKKKKRKRIKSKR